MPNWCENELEVSGPIDDVQSFYDHIVTGTEEDKYGKKQVQLNITTTIMPMPTVLEGTRSPHPLGEFDGDGQYTALVEDESNEFWTQEKYEERKAEHYDLKERSEKAFAETGYHSWYDWANDVWGTKWGSCDVQWTGGENIDEESKTSTRFFSYETAWGPLSEDFWVKASEMFPTLKFTVYYEEHGMCFHGIDAYHEGEVVFSRSDELPTSPEDATDEEADAFYDGSHYYELIEAKTAIWHKEIDRVYEASLV